ncbi:MAG: DUF1549 domain-containing protein [Planctomycetota bacterium]
MRKVPTLLCVLLAVSGALCVSSDSRADRVRPRDAAEQIDRLLAEALFQPETELAPRSDDSTFARRVWLDLVGDIPTPERLTAFLIDPSPKKRQRLVNELLAKPQYGQNWARYWRDVIYHRRINERAVVGADPTVVWMTERLNSGAGWDQIATEMITVQGDVREQGSAAIILAQDGETEETAAEVSRIFLGVQIQCAQCHDHPWDRWQREQFHELAAFFPRVGLRQVQTATRRTYEVVSNDRPERGKFRRQKNDNYRGVAEHYMSDLAEPESPGTRTQPRFFLTGAELPFGTRDSSRRGNLAEWMTGSEWFAKAFINRMWAELVGEGFFEPVDDMGPDRTPTAGAVLDYLAGEFAASGFDVKWLMRAITATEAYGRESRPRRGVEQTPMRANVAQRLRGDQLFSALLTTLDVDEPKSGPLADRIPGANYGSNVTPRKIFNVAFGYDPSTPRASVNQSIPQALAMMNTPRVNQAVAANRGTMLARLMNRVDEDDLIVDELYLRSLSRLPSDEERDRALAYVAGINYRGEAFSDLLWSLINSAEFTHRR